MAGVPVSQLPFHLAPWALLWLLALLVFVPGFLLAERAAISRGRVAPYTLVVLVGSVLVAALIFPAVDWLGFPAQALVPPGSLAPRPVTPFLASCCAWASWPSCTPATGNDWRRRGPSRPSKRDGTR